MKFGFAAIAVLLCLALMAMCGAQTATIPSAIANPTGILQQWLPIVSVAVLISIAVGAFIYVVGYLLNDQQMRARGITEVGQSAGTLIFAVIIVSVLIMFGSLVANSGILSSQGQFAQAMSNMCTNYLHGAPTDIVNSQLASTPTNTVCNAESAAGAGSISYIDYGLTSTYLIVANLTNQAANNLNALYQYEGYVGFLTGLTSDPGLCLPAACASPLVPRTLSISLTSSPYAGFNLISFITRPLETQAVLIMYLMLTQLLITFMALLIWPWLLAAGIILRAVPFTRSAGGLLMGITLALVILYPLTMILEYSALSGGAPTGQLIGAPAAPQVTWNWGDGSTSIGYGVEHIYQGDGQYTITASVDANGQTYSASQTILVQANGGEVQGSASSPTSAQAKMSFTYDQSGLLVATQLSSLGSLQDLIGRSFYGLETTVGGPAAKPSQQQDIVTYNTLTPNFYVFPSVAKIANYHGCYVEAAGGTLAGEEILDSAKIAITLGLGAALSYGGFVAAPPSLSGVLATPCVPGAAIATSLDLIGVYGLMSIAGFILPMLNILIVIAGIKNLSYLFGGDTDLAGIGKLV